MALADGPAKQAGSSTPREVHILILDKDKSLLSAIWHALDSDGWQIRGAGDTTQALRAIASQDWTVVIANAAITGLRGPLYETLKTLSEAPAVEGNVRRARVLFLVPEEIALEAQPALEAAHLPYTCKPINLNDLLEKVSDLMMEAQALAEPIRRVRDQRGRKKGQQSGVFNKRKLPEMFAAREDYSLTEEELAEFERAEAASRKTSSEKKKDPKDLGAPTK